METRTALVTGGSGYLGSVLSKKLKSDGWNVICFDKRQPEHKYFDYFVQGDIRDYGDVQCAFHFEEIDVVFHLAGRIEVGESMKHPTEFWSVNVSGTVTLLDVMAKFNVKNIIFSSTAAVYWPTLKPIPETECIVNNSVYGQTKRACEMAIEDSKFNYTIFRYFNLAGADDDVGENHFPETHLIPCIFNNLNTFTIYGDNYKTEDGTCMRDYVHVCDVADAHITAANKMLEKCTSLGIFNLGSGKGYTILEIINLIEKYLGLDVKYTFGKSRAGDPDSLLADISLAKKVLDYNPKHDILSILNSAYEWYNKNDKHPREAEGTSS